jgi:polyisoprenoid-binding protein YceI
LYYNKANPQQSKFNGTLRASSINTGVTMRDNHLRSKEYFNVLDFPEIIFISSNINVISSNELNVSGTLNIKGISKKVSFNVKVSSDTNKDVLNATLVLNRLDFGIGKSSWTLSDVVSLNLRYTQENK